MFPLLSFLIALILSASALAMTGQAPPASGWAARAIVMVIDKRGDLCTGTALARDLVLTAAHCVTRNEDYQVRPFQTDATIAVRSVAMHPRFDLASYAASRATADVALVKLASDLPETVVPAALAPARRVKVGDTLTVAGFGTVAPNSARGLGQPREAKLVVTGIPGSLQVRLYDKTTRNLRPGLGACTGDSGGPVFDGPGPQSGDVIGVISWTTAAQNEEGCGGLTGVTPLIAYRDWIIDTAKKFNSPIGP